MERPVLHIPSVITQSCFVNDADDVIQLTPKEIDYFYLLLYLYRTKLLRQTSNLLVKNENRHQLNEEAKFDSVCIEAITFNIYGVAINHQYNGLKLFIEKLSKLSIKLNMFNKDRDLGLKTIKLVDCFDWDSNVLTIRFVDDFTKLIAHTVKLFMSVDLSNVFQLSSGKAKLLYLQLLDFKGTGRRYLEKDELQQLIGVVPQTSMLELIVNQINKVTDINVSCSIEGKKLKTYEFSISYKKKFRKPSKNEVNSELIVKSKQQLEQMKSKGKVINNEEGYLRAIYKNEIAKSEATDAEELIDQWVEKIKSECEYDKNSDGVPFVVLRANQFGDQIFIDDAHRLADSFMCYTNTPNETLEMLNSWNDNNQLDYGVNVTPGYPKKFRKMCLLTDDQLKQRGLI